MTQNVQTKLQEAGLRPTRQRVALGELLFSGEDRHVTAERLFEEAQSLSLSVSLATVYNTLHQFTEVGLLKEVMVESGKTYFDTNTCQHFHYYCEENGHLSDLQTGIVDLERLIDIPEGMEVSSVDVTVHLKPKKEAE